MELEFLGVLTIRYPVVFTDKIFSIIKQNKDPPSNLIFHSSQSYHQTWKITLAVKGKQLFDWIRIQIIFDSHTQTLKCIQRRMINGPTFWICAVLLPSWLAAFAWQCSVSRSWLFLLQGCSQMTFESASAQTHIHWRQDALCKSHLMRFIIINLSFMKVKIIFTTNKS